MSADKRRVEQAMVKADGVEHPIGPDRRMSFRRPAQAGLLVAAVVAAGTVAAAAAAVNPFSAAAGSQVQARPHAQAIGTGQEVAMGTSDHVSVGLKLTQDIPFAPGYESWRAGTIAFQTTLGPGAPPNGQAYILSSALRWQVAEAAVCSWLNYYVASQAAGNTAASTSATAQIRAAPTWPAITGFNVADSLGRVVAAVGAGDAKLVQALIDSGQVGNCIAVGPFPPAGMSQADVQAKLAAARQVGQQEIATDPIARRLGISGASSAAPASSGGG